jgi:Putative adhesin
MMRRALCFTAVLATALVADGLAQSQTQGSGGFADTWCGNGTNEGRASWREVRDATIGGANPLDIDAGRNGGIRIRGWDRGDVLVRANVVGCAGTEADARRLVSGVHIQTAGPIRADGPDATPGEHWSVSFEVQLPRTALLKLNTWNGGISIDDFRGAAEFRAHNGGVSLSNVGGDIRGGTTNGGLHIDLRGDRWDGMGLDVETHNGGIQLAVPENYSAELETGTTRGRVRFDFPLTVQGTIGQHITTTLGAGGAKVRAITTNGGVSIHRS